ncbi:unnamed protein product [Onchocerca flexuosa]|nr:unnamed protein product [Onchocerca flexuosa]
MNPFGDIMKGYNLLFLLVLFSENLIEISLGSPHFMRVTATEQSTLKWGMIDACYWHAVRSIRTSSLSVPIHPSVINRFI